MDMGPGTDLGARSGFAVTRVLITAAMMLPAALPALLRVSAGHGAAAAAPVAFALGDLAVWTLLGLGAWIALAPGSVPGLTLPM